ncbi:hypothetical protein IF2G_08484 [Cordyceps javanica]|nr:hypothetical protein IF2G_08484 [Cordyceps javanica]
MNLGYFEGLCAACRAGQRVLREHTAESNIKSARTGNMGDFHGKVSCRSRMWSIPFHLDPSSFGHVCVYGWGTSDIRPRVNDQVILAGRQFCLGLVYKPPVKRKKNVLVILGTWVAVRIVVGYYWIAIKCVLFICRASLGHSLLSSLSSSLSLTIASVSTSEE